jgi:mannose-6-phosphate isomerase-like protein (cupin superfamily)
MKLILTALLCAGFALPAADPDGLHVWKAAELKGLSRALAPKLNGTTTALEQLPGVGNFSFIKIYRNGTGQAELHETQADVFVVETGSATLVYGGKLVDAKTTAPHEMRGSSIEGGMEKKLAAGDIVSIPANLPHWVKLDPEKDIAYFLVKVTQ